MEQDISDIIQEIMTKASAQGAGEIWAAYNTLLWGYGSDWEALADISEVSANLVWENIKSENEEKIGIFQAMNGMVMDYAHQHLDEKDYHLFLQNYVEWIAAIPF